MVQVGVSAPRSSTRDEGKREAEAQCKSYQVLVILVGFVLGAVYATAGPMTVNDQLRYAAYKGATEAVKVYLATAASRLPRDTRGYQTRRCAGTTTKPCRK